MPDSRHSQSTRDQLTVVVSDAKDREAIVAILADTIPSRCPITQQPFFRLMEHPVRGWVPTYGGPFDSYTIPEAEPVEGKPIHEWELVSQHFDHDEGDWSEWREVLGVRLINEDDLNELLSK